jgi:hypothetical protein
MPFRPRTCTEEEGCYAIMVQQLENVSSTHITLANLKSYSKIALVWQQHCHVLLDNVGHPYTLQTTKLVVNKYAPQNWFPYLIATWGG